MAISRCDVHADPSRMEIPQHGSLLLVFYEDDMEPMDVPMHWHEKMEYRKTEQKKTVCFHTASEMASARMHAARGRKTSSTSTMVIFMVDFCAGLRTVQIHVGVTCQA